MFFQTHKQFKMSLCMKKLKSSKLTIF